METNKRKSGSKYLILGILAILLISNGVLIWQLTKARTSVRTVIIEKEAEGKKNDQLQNELDSLLNEYNRIKSEYGNLSNQLTERDSIIVANAKEIQKLINRQEDYSRIKKNLDLLRKMTQGYVSQLDSLFTVNKALNKENKEIKQILQQEIEKSTVLSKDKEELTTKVNMASTLKAYNITGTPINLKSGGKKEQVTDKAKKVDAIKVCFTLSENLLVAGGNKIIYIRIVSPPDNKVLTKSQYDTFVYNGESIQYSIKKEINYDNSEINLCLYWNQSEVFKEGAYQIEVFIDGYQIGKGNFVLK